jgi:hypothetical protein
MRKKRGPMSIRVIAVPLAVSVTVLAVIACGGSAAPTTAPTVPPAPTQPPPAEPVGSCEPTDQELELGRAYNLDVSAGSYPEACHYYCVRVPEGGERLEFSLTGFDVDLDIYVDQDLSVLAFSDHGQWESNDYGTGDESISIFSPEGGPYYAQVCSYEGLASPFTLQVDWTR